MPYTLSGHTDRPTLEAVAAGLHQADPLRARLEADSIIPRRQRANIANDVVSGIVNGVATLPQTDASQNAVEKLR